MEYVLWGFDRANDLINFVIVDEIGFVACEVFQKLKINLFTFDEFPLMLHFINIVEILCSKLAAVLKWQKEEEKELAIGARKIVSEN